MGDEWKERTLGEIAENISRSFEFGPHEKIVFINTGDVLEGKFLHTDTITKVGLPGQAKKAIQKGDILFSEIRPGNKRFALVDFEADNFVVSTKFMVVKLNDPTVDLNFFYLLLTNRQTLNEFQRIAESRSGTFPQITFDTVSYFPFQIPQWDQQKAIANILGTLDDKIELNRKMNATLESMAQAMFKSWFVDFDPVIDNALAAGNPIPEPLQPKAQTRKELGDQKKSLPPDIQKLFPNQFQFNDELGWIPEGWSTGELGDYATVKRGGSPRPIHDYLTDQGLPWVKIRDATSSPTRFLTKTKEFIKPEGLSKTVMLNQGTLILSNSATPGLPMFLDLDACIHDGWLHFPETRVFSDYYLYQLFLVVRKELLLQGNGSVFTNLKTDILRSHGVVIPPTGLLDSFDCKASAIHFKLSLLQKETESLTKLRDTLLPKLLSGELRIPDAEKLVAEQV